MRLKKKTSKSTPSRVAVSPLSGGELTPPPNKDKSSPGKGRCPEGEEGCLRKSERPDTLHGLTCRIETNAGRLFVTVNFKQNLPFEVFLRVGKHGGDLGPYVGSLARLISISLRYGVPVADIIAQLDQVQGRKSFVLPSVPDAIAEVFNQILKED